MMTTRRFRRPMSCAVAHGTVLCGKCKSEVTVALYRNDPEWGGGVDLDGAHVAPDGWPCDLTEEEAELAIEQLMTLPDQIHDTTEEQQGVR